jgi:hypothetical protein
MEQWCIYIHLVILQNHKNVMFFQFIRREMLFSRFRPPNILFQFFADGKQVYCFIQGLLTPGGIFSFRTFKA